MFDELRSVPRTKDYAKSNKDLDDAINKVRQIYPNHFLLPADLHKRTFYDEPGDHRVPLQSFVVPAKRKGGA
jgi:hypothetical protein